MHVLDVDWEHPTDPRPGPRLDHVRAYVTTAGADGHLWHGVPTLLLTTLDRDSGRTLRTPLIYCEDAGRHLVLASAYGAPEHPAGTGTSPPTRRSASRSAPPPSWRRRAPPRPGSGRCTGRC